MSTQLPVNYRSDIVFYSVGDVFRTPYESIAVLAQVSNSLVCLILLNSDCNRWTDPIKVENIRRITMDELDRITKGYEFKRMGKLT